MLIVQNSTFAPSLQSVTATLCLTNNGCLVTILLSRDGLSLFTQHLERFPTDPKILILLFITPAIDNFIEKCITPQFHPNHPCCGSHASKPLRVTVMKNVRLCLCFKQNCAIRLLPAASLDMRSLHCCARLLRTRRKETQTIFHTPSYYQSLRWRWHLVPNKQAAHVKGIELNRVEPRLTNPDSTRFCCACERGMR